MKEIVAARIGTIITTDPKTIMKALEENTIADFMDRDRMKFMAACDLGEKWERLANAKTLFCIDDRGKPQPPIGKEQVHKAIRSLL